MSPTPTPTPTNNPSQLHILRSLMPNRELSLHEAMQRAELQAAKLMQLAGVTDGPIPDSVITSQPRIIVENSNIIPGSGTSTWERSAWRITLNANEPDVRRRFTLAHEFKHILDAPYEQQTYNRLRTPANDTNPDGEHHPQIEQICDYFAACLLMPKKLIKSIWGQGLHNQQALANYFDVSKQAMHIRLQALGLIERPQYERRPRCNYSTTRGNQTEQGQPRLTPSTAPTSPTTFWRSASQSFRPTNQPNPSALLELTATEYSIDVTTPPRLTTPSLIGVQT